MVPTLKSMPPLDHQLVSVRTGGTVVVRFLAALGCARFLGRARRRPRRRAVVALGYLLGVLDGRRVG